MNVEGMLRHSFRIYCHKPAVPASIFNTYLILPWRWQMQNRSNFHSINVMFLHLDLVVTEFLETVAHSRCAWIVSYTCALDGLTMSPVEMKFLRFFQMLNVLTYSQSWVRFVSSPVVLVHITCKFIHLQFPRGLRCPAIVRHACTILVRRQQQPMASYWIHS